MQERVKAPKEADIAHKNIKKTKEKKILPQRIFTEYN